MVSTRKNPESVQFSCSTPIKKGRKCKQLKESFNAIAKNFALHVQQFIDANQTDAVENSKTQATTSGV